MWGKRRRAAALQDAIAKPDGPRTARRVLECASPLALWAGAMPKARDDDQVIRPAGGEDQNGLTTVRTPALTPAGFCTVL